MRMSLIVASMTALIAGGDASAQRVVTAGPGAGYPAPEAQVGTPMPTGTAVGHAPRGPGSRWGSKVDGRWWAGANAPGGWRAYRHQQRGWRLPGYWNQPNFYIGDWADYGLGQPPLGYSWTRYYDDAVLIDDRGQVYDYVDGVNWDGPGGGYDAGYVQPTYGQSTYAPGYRAEASYAAAAGYPLQAGYGERGYVERRNSGVGGAIAGAAVGGVAGNLIAGRGNRLAGTLIGAGVGGSAGYAIDRSHSHRVPVAPRQPYDAAPYGGPGAGYPPPPPPPPPMLAPPPPPGVWHSPDGGTTVTTTSVGGYAGGSTTVVTVQTAPVITTTTTDVVEDHVTYSRWPVRHKWVRRSACGCR